SRNRQKHACRRQPALDPANLARIGWSLRAPQETMLYVNVQCASLPAELRLVRYGIVSHIIDKKDWEQVKTFRLAFSQTPCAIPAFDPFDLLRVTSVTRVFSNPSLKWHRGSLAHLFPALD